MTRKSFLRMEIDGRLRLLRILNQRVSTVKKGKRFYNSLLLQVISLENVFSLLLLEIKDEILCV